MYPTYNFLRPTVVFASILTTVQSIAWISSCIYAIVAYYCHATPNVNNTFEGLFGLTMFHVYFRGECELGLPETFFGHLDGVQTLHPLDIHAWMWVYLVTSFVWFITGLLLLVYVNKDNMKYANFYLYMWIFNTLIIAILDIVLGAFFARDFHNISVAARSIILENESSSVAVVLMARDAAWTMLVISFRGFVLWIINVSIAFYLMSHTFAIYDHNRVKSGFTNNAFVDDRPISGYDPFTPKPWYSGTNNEIPRVKANTMNNQQRTAFGINLYGDMEPKRPVSVNQIRNEAARDRRSNIPNPDYSPQLPRSLRLQNNLDSNSERSDQRSINRGLRRYYS